jgi:multiple sugar transport system ATP-binding protein
MSTLQLKALNKCFEQTEVIHAVDLDIKHGEFVVFVGPSGCGKSTLLRLIAGLEAATAGDIYIDEIKVNDVGAADRGCAMVFQSYALYPHMSVYENMAFALENIKAAKSDIDEKVQAAAKMLKLEQLLARKPTQLSGGQKQRVAIGRAIVRDPKIFLFDEPLSNLDAELRISMRAELRALHDKIGATMIYVTHDQVEAMTMADKIVVLRAGKIEQVGAPLTLYNQPANEFVAGFIGSPRMNFLQAAHCPRLWLSDRAAHKIGIRPEHLSLSPASDASLSIKITQIEQLGAQSLIRGQVTTSNDTLEVVLPGQSTCTAGELIHLTADAGKLHYFDQQGIRI